jgi:hypothetical protein
MAKGKRLTATTDIARGSASPGLSRTATPNRIQVCEGSGLSITTLTWATPARTSVQVQGDTPDGALFAAGGARRCPPTDKWASQRPVFYLQTVTGGLLLTSANTLATVTDNLTTQGGGALFYKAINYTYNSVGACWCWDKLLNSDPINMTTVLYTISFCAH